ncbi:hypothetical protein Agub_g8048 [Astrephomene gubernaculifera]|uniref:Centrosomal protein of 19 kDa n=1 Tax=Astrephomene gubernaculifera TaxID=47775 RepID=A0AAD3DV83_9CHLO|nr:hypothetical protein Agub_g8048 [Astrephomene gubernaculifera]
MVVYSRNIASAELMTSAVNWSATPSSTGNGSIHRAEDAATPEQDGCYRAKRYALKFDPPCIFLEYEDISKKRRVRAVKLTTVQASTDVDRLTRKVIRSFPRKLDSASVKYDQVRKLVVKLLDYLAANEAAAAAGSHLNGGGLGGLSSPSTSSGSGTASGVMSAYGQAPPLLPTSSPRTDTRGRLSPYFPNGSGGGGGGAFANGNNYRASVESTMSRFSTSTGGSSGEDEERAAAGGAGGGEEGPDELLSALDDLSRELGPGGIVVSASTRVSSEVGSSHDSPFSSRDRPVGSLSGRVGPGSSNSSSVEGPVLGCGGGAKSRFAVEAEAAEKLVIGLELSGDLDLNKVTEVELKMAKAAMEQDFRKNQLRPGDPGYEYDKQEDFGPPVEPNDWDDSDDEEEGGAEASEEPEVDWAEIHESVRKPSITTQQPQQRQQQQIKGGDSSTGDLSTSGAGGNGGNSSQSPYNSNDWP